MSLSTLNYSRITDNRKQQFDLTLESLWNIYFKIMIGFKYENRTEMYQLLKY